MGVIRSAFVSGTTTNNPLAIGDTTLNSANLSSLAAVASPDIAKIILDPLGLSGAPEVVYVTAHTASATTATISRAAEGTTARQFAAGTTWVNGPTLVDWGTPVAPATQTAYNPLHDFWKPDIPLGGSLSNFAHPVNNKAFLMPFQVLQANCTVTTLIGSIGIQSGNIDVGVYMYDGTTFTKIVSLGSTACPAASTNVVYNITDTVFYRGVRYYYAIAADNTTVTFGRWSADATITPFATSFGFSKVTSFPLPATIISAAASTGPYNVLYGTISGGSAV